MNQHERMRQRMGNAQLTEDEVRAIRRLAHVHSAREIAKLYGLGAETIRRLLRGETWAWVKDTPLDMPLSEVSAPPLTDTERVAADAMLQRVLKKTGLEKLAQIREEQTRPGREVLEELRKEGLSHVPPSFDWIKK